MPELELDGERLVRGRAVRAAVVGLGLWGQNHVDLYLDDPRSELALVCDLDADRARAIAEATGARWTTDVREVADADVDAVSVATPDHSHFPIARDLLAAGKHVLVEKPLTNQLAEATELAALAARQRVVAMVDFHLRWRPQLLEVKHQLDEGAIGVPHMGYMRISDTMRVATEWLSWAAASGPEWFLFSHSMDAMTWLLGRRPESVFARGHRGILAARGIDGWDAIQASVGYGDCFVTFETSWVVPDSIPTVVDNDFALYGDRGRITLDVGSGLRLAAAERFLELPAPVGGRRDVLGRLTHFIYDPIRHFVGAVRGDVAPLATFADGVLNVAMIEATLQSLERGVPVPVASPERVG